MPSWAPSNRLSDMGISQQGSSCPSWTTFSLDSLPLQCSVLIQSTCFVRWGANILLEWQYGILLRKPPQAVTCPSPHSSSRRASSLVLRSKFRISKPMKALIPCSEVKSARVALSSAEASHMAWCMVCSSGGGVRRESHK